MGEESSQFPVSQWDTAGLGTRVWATGNAHGPIPQPPTPRLKPGGCLPFHPYWTEVFTFHSAVCMVSTKLRGTFFFKVAQDTLKGWILAVLIPWQYFNHAESIQQQLL